MRSKNQLKNLVRTGFPGEKNGRAKHTAEEVQAVRRMLMKGVPIEAIIEKSKSPKSWVLQIKYRCIWKSLPWPASKRIRPLEDDSYDEHYRIGCPV